jgi:HAD superfamily hydrolase (TIGR01509 family)
MIAELCRHSDPCLPFDEIWAQYPRKKELFRERMSHADAVSAPVGSLMSELKQRYLLAVVTSSGQREIEPILETAGLMPMLDTVVYGGDVIRLKPAPDPYLLAARRLGVSRALVVEDSEAGLAAGRAAGFDVLHVPAAEQTCELVRDRLGL